MNNYWTATDNYLNEHEGHGPVCPNCKKEMFPQDDHGRFTCFCEMGGVPEQVNNVTGLSDEQKARIPPINRLHATPTKVEAVLLNLLIKGPGAMDTPEYAAAMKAVEEERQKK